MSLREILNSKLKHQRNHSDITQSQVLLSNNNNQNNSQQQLSSQSALFRTPQKNPNNNNLSMQKFSSHRKNSSQNIFEINSASTNTSQQNIKLPKIISQEQRQNNNNILKKWNEPQSYDSMLQQADEQLKKKGRNFNIQFNQPQKHQSLSAVNSPNPKQGKNQDFLKKMVSLYANSEPNNKKENIITKNFSMHESQTSQQNQNQNQQVQQQDKENKQQQQIINQIRQQQSQQQLNKSQTSFNILLKKSNINNSNTNNQQNNLLNRLDQRQEKVMQNNSQIIDNSKQQQFQQQILHTEPQSSDEMVDGVTQVSLQRKKRVKLKPCSLIENPQQQIQQNNQNQMQNSNQKLNMKQQYYQNAKSLNKQSSNDSETSIMLQHNNSANFNHQRDNSVTSIKSCLKNKSNNGSESSIGSPRRRSEKSIKKSVFFDQKMKVYDPIKGQEEIHNVKDNQKQPTKNLSKFFSSARTISYQN